jgi:3-hydroxyisobutyrate dehydrogenase
VKIGVAGTGRMGAAVAGRLASLGHEVKVWNRDASKARATGLPSVATPRELAAACEAVISFLTDAAAVEAVYAQMLEGPVKGKLFIEMSTVRPADSKKTAAKVAAAGAAFVECPVGGSVGPAKEGKLFGFAGGAPGDVERARPILEQLCRRVEHVGPVGAGGSMKLAINLPLLVYWQALGEALALIRHLELDPERVMGILGDTSGAPAMLKNRAAAIATALAGRDTGTVSVDIDTMGKDLREMAAEARSLGRAAPVTKSALECFEQASRAGLGKKDCVMIPVAWSMGKPAG